MAYSAESDLNNCWGTDQVREWSDLAGAGAVDSTRTAWAIEVADDYLDCLFRTLNYQVPVITSAAATPVLVTYLSATLAGILLYESRGTQDFNIQTGEPFHRLAYKLDWFKRTLDELFSGRLKLNAV